MSPEKQRIAIAEACSTAFGGKVRFGGDDDGNLLVSWSAGYPNGYWDSFEPVPDYLNDLNAMHEAEKGLTSEQWSDYNCHILATMPEDWRDCTEERLKNYIHATAAQRAEAFLKTLDKWEK